MLETPHDRAPRERGVRYTPAILFALYRRETLRFVKLWRQTLLGPMVSSGLFLTVFYFVLAPYRPSISGVNMMTFIASGLAGMSAVQNTFGNVTSSIVSSRYTGAIRDVLLSPLAPWEIMLGHVFGGMTRGVVLLVVLCAIYGFIFPVYMTWAALGIGILFALLGLWCMACLGLITGLWSTSFERLSMVDTFIVGPLAFLSGTFYSPASLPHLFKTILYFNPMFYIIFGMRTPMVGTGLLGAHFYVLGFFYLAILASFLGVASWLLVRRGYGLRT